VLLLASNPVQGYLAHKKQELLKRVGVSLKEQDFFLNGWVTSSKLANFLKNEWVF